MRRATLLLLLLFLLGVQGPASCTPGLEGVEPDDFRIRPEGELLFDPAGAIVASSLVVQAGWLAEAVPGPTDAAIVAFDVNTHEEQWRFRISDPDGRSSRFDVLKSAAGRVCAAGRIESGDGLLDKNLLVACFRARTGALLWTTEVLLERVSFAPSLELSERTLGVLFRSAQVIPLPPAPLPGVVSQPPLVLSFDARDGS